MAALKASSAALDAESVAFTYPEPTFEVAAPNAEAAVAETVSPRSSARCLRTRARSWLTLVPCGTGISSANVRDRHWTLLTADAVLVAEFLQLGLAPRVNELVRQAVVGSPGAGLRGSGLFLHAQVCKTGVASNRGDEFVALQFLSV